MKVSAFDYQLPPELIAQTPAEPRDSARLLVYSRANKTIQHKVFRDVVDMLDDRYVVVGNQTKVEPRRLYVYKQDTKGKVELLLLDKVGDNIWRCKVSPGIRVGQELVGEKERKQLLRGEVIALEEEEGNRLIQFDRPAELVWDELGVLPIPPYIKNYHGDQSMYQTVYAQTDGSVAAPTAGRHFTEELMQKMRDKQIEFRFLTLHVSRDTAFPIVKEEHVEDVSVHSEQTILTAEDAQFLVDAKKAGKKIISVGTTSTRALEGIAQRHPHKQLSEFVGEVDLFISPGYEFSFIDGMITNFHFPRSSLIMLVSALIGVEELLRIYQEAIQERYRFFTFGDAMLIV